jgi:hypothetical protein
VAVVRHGDGAGLSAQQQQAEINALKSENSGLRSRLTQAKRELSAARDGLDKALQDVRRLQGELDRGRAMWAKRPKAPEMPGLASVVANNIPNGHGELRRWAAEMYQEAQRCRAAIALLLETQRAVAIGRCERFAPSTCYIESVGEQRLKPCPFCKAVATARGSVARPFLADMPRHATEKGEEAA